MLQGQNLKHPALDWWSVGVIIFELLVGIPPFNADEVKEIFDNILNNKIPWDALKIGDGEGKISLAAYDIINKFLEPNVNKRLGSNGI